LIKIKIISYRKDSTKKEDANITILQREVDPGVNYYQETNKKAKPNDPAFSLLILYKSLTFPPREGHWCHAPLILSGSPHKHKT